MKKISALLGVILFAGFLNAEPIQESFLLDTPTAAALERYGAAFNTRFFSEGSVMQSFDFGVYPNLNIGFAISAQNLIGNELPVRVLTPAFFVKYKLYDGSLYLPALAIGYDGRKYGYHRPSKKYRYEDKGGYAVLSREIIIPNLEASAGVNLSDFDSSDVFFFSALSYDIEEKFKLIAEWDNVHTVKDSWLNFGLRFFATEHFAVDLAVRDVTAKHFERVVQVKYKTSF